jgi:hypothetical protein
MSIKPTFLVHFKSRKTVTLVLLSFFAVGAFATLGDGTSKKSATKNILSDKSILIRHGGFSLKSGYNYRGNNVINPERQDTYINLNTVATFQKGNRTYILPIKSKVLLQNVKISAGIPQLNR